jgi:hypothetical protein
MPLDATWPCGSLLTTAVTLASSTQIDGCLLLYVRRQLKEGQKDRYEHIVEEIFGLRQHTQSIALTRVCAYNSQTNARGGSSAGPNYGEFP